MKTFERQTIQVGLYEVNCTILAAEGRAWVVDPGSEPERILAQLTKKNLAPQAILLTHAHFDHIGGVNGLQKAFPALPVFIGAPDAAVITHPFNQMPPDYPPVRPFENVRLVNDGDSIPDLGAHVIATPGHTPGGVCYLLDNPEGTPLLLAGDTLFAGSVGRTDLPGGDMRTLMQSLAKLKVLADKTEVIPGHGTFTTIGREKTCNPFLR